MSSKIRKVRESVKKNVAYNQGYKCFECKNILPPSYQIDHIIPHSISADDNINNLQALCSNCHSNKSQKESLRIQQYKTLVSKLQSNKHICWFCLEDLTTARTAVKQNQQELKEVFNLENEHICDKICKDIEKTLKKYNDLTSSFSEKYKYNSINLLNRDREKLSVVKKLQKLSLGTNLHDSPMEEELTTDLVFVTPDSGNWSQNGLCTGGPVPRMDPLLFHPQQQAGETAVQASPLKETTRPALRCPKRSLSLVNSDLDDNILHISLSKKYIYVKNYIYKNGDDFTIDDIVEAVTIATRTKRDSFKYIKVEIKLILNGTYDEKNNCVDYLSENIIDTFPERIFKKDVDIDYEFICI